MPPPNIRLAKMLVRAGVSPTIALDTARHPDDAKGLLRKLAAQGRTRSGTRPIRVPGPSMLQ